MKSEHLDVLNTHCGWCGGELPIEAPVTAKYCCPECRWAAMQAKNQEENAVRRKLRQKRKAAIGPRFCLQCGKEIPSTANLHRKFCGVACCDDHHNAKRHAKIKAERAALREAAPPRYCEHCGTVLPKDAPSYQRFCSRICQEGINLGPPIFKSTRA